jgi:hypothetical protein
VKFTGDHPNAQEPRLFPDFGQLRYLAENNLRATWRLLQQYRPIAEGTEQQAKVGSDAQSGHFRNCSWLLRPATKMPVKMRARPQAYAEVIVGAKKQVTTAGPPRSPHIPPNFIPRSREY